MHLSSIYYWHLVVLLFKAHITHRLITLLGLCHIKKCFILKPKLLEAK